MNNHKIKIGLLVSCLLMAMSYFLIRPYYNRVLSNNYSHLSNNSSFKAHHDDEIFPLTPDFSYNNRINYLYIQIVKACNDNQYELAYLLVNDLIEFLEVITKSKTTNANKIMLIKDLKILSTKLKSIMTTKNYHLEDANNLKDNFKLVLDLVKPESER